MNIVISIIVPVYNVEKHLKKCIDSVLKQTYTNWELLLIDDGSTDMSGKLCDLYSSKDDRIKVFHQKNGGVSSARNVGIDNASGEWITFIDSDDWIKPTHLECFINYSEGVDMVSMGFFAYNWHFLDDNEIYEPDCLVNGCKLQGYLLHQYITSQMGFVWCKMFKRSIIERYNIRYNINYRFMEDAEFVARYCSHIESLYNSASTTYQYQFTAPGKKFGFQENYPLMVSIYKAFLNINGTEESKNYVDNTFYNGSLRALYLDTYSMSLERLYCNVKSFYSLFNKKGYTKTLSGIREGFIFCISKLRLSILLLICLKFSQIGKSR